METGIRREESRRGGENESRREEAARDEAEVRVRKLEEQVIGLKRLRPKGSLRPESKQSRHQRKERRGGEPGQN